MKAIANFAPRIALSTPILLALPACGPSEQPADNFEAEAVAPPEEPVAPMENFEAAQEDGPMDDGAMTADPVENQTTGDPAFEEGM